MNTVANPQQLWNQVLSALQLQMTRATYDTWLAGTTLVSVNEEACVIAVKNQSAQDWLQNRLYETIKRTLTSLMGQEIPLRFIVTANGTGPKPATPVPSKPTQPRTGLDFIRNISFDSLWYDSGGTGYDRMSKYCAQFWRAYLSRLNPKCYSLWEFLQVADTRNVSASAFTHWTPVKKYRVRALARTLGCAPATISGGFRQCPVFNAALAEGRVLDSCCGNYQPVRMKVSRYGNPQCLHWVSGAFEQLYQAGLLAITVTGDAPRSTFHHLQVWRLLPLLTPYQVQQLHEVEQEAHERWLEKHAHKGGFRVDAWSAIVEPSLVPLMSGYDEGRSLYDVYQPNPLLDTMESNNS